MAQTSGQFGLIGGAGYWMEMVKCQDACPVHTDACGYVNAIAEGRDEEAYRIARATNPFASICGRVCGAPCETNCRRGSLDEPVSIRALKRFVTSQYGPETGDATHYAAGCNQEMLPPDRGDYEPVAVIGAGAAGMTVAHDLAILGYKVTVFEAHATPGGMLTAGVPVFRLPRELVMAEINAILSLGVELKCNQRLGRDFSIADLRARGFKAIFLGVGLPKGRKLELPGAGLDGVYDGMDFLRAFNEGNPLPVGKRIIVIGGGNVAYDVARSAVRPLDALDPTEAVADMGRGESVAYDVARSAKRLSDDKEVHVVCLEGRSEMPADEIEVTEGAEEGLILHNSRGPREITGENGTVSGLRTVDCISVFDANGRFNPTFHENSVETISADTIIFSIGQTSDLSFLQPADGVESVRGLIKVDQETYQTTAPDVFACGDIAHGPRLFIHAIRSAQIAARSMHDYLRGTRTEEVVHSFWERAAYTMREDWDQLQRAHPPVAPARERANSLQIVEEVFPPETARAQAARCLRCNVNTVFETAICVACTGCVDVCPESLIRLTGLDDLCKTNEGSDWVAGLLGVPPGEMGKVSTEDLSALGGVLLKDESTCIRCGLCAARCPSHAITMQRFNFRRQCVSIPGVHPKLKYSALPFAADQGLGKA
ncbi:MAG TPA: FAD-dependent oxidoreductase [Terracidiphilus sp.]|jgi:NADPH-dependent glutamate synthase beta subunit-like oxidoreductase